jgi:hypothetical protein
MGPRFRGDDNAEAASRIQDDFKRQTLIKSDDTG